MADHRDKLLQIVRMKGPLVPSQINRELNTNLIFASAMLSELVDSKILRLSHLKVGGSPLYYSPGQESRLQDYSKKLNEKDQRAYELLRQAKVLRDKDQEPLMRACLREIRDFAVPLEVNFEGGTELFWKWYLLPVDEVEPLVRQRLGIVTQQPKEDPVLNTNSNATDTILEKKLELTRKVLSEQTPSVSSEEKIKEREELPKKREQKLTKHEDTKAKSTPQKIEHDNTLSGEFIDRGEMNDEFFRRIKSFFDENKIRILSHKILRKESDMEFIIEIPSNVGKLSYFCKARSKQKYNEGDISSVYIQSQSKKLPVLFLTTGELTKKAQDILRNEFKSMTVKQL